MVPNEAEIIEQMKRLAEEPDALELVTRHAASIPGPWAGWTLARQLWFLRKRQGLTQAGLARRAGITQARLSRIESGSDAKWSTLTAVLAALGFDPVLLPGKPGRSREHRHFPKRRGERPGLRPGFPRAG